MNTTQNSITALQIAENAIQQHRLHKTNSRRAALKRKAYITITGISLVLILIILFNGIIIANAGVSDEVKSEQYKYYTSIQIEKDDTLWSIASNYADNSTNYSTVQYVNDLKELNNLHTDCIYQGQNLIVYYYSTELK